MKLSYKNRYIKESNSIVKMLMPPLLGIILCITCLMGTTWSWFTATVSTSEQSINAANYSITVNIQDGEELEEGKYSLSQKAEGDGYRVTVKASGSTSTGYFKVSGPDGFIPLYSTQLAPGEKISFTFYPELRGEYYFESVWGTYTGGKGNTINHSSIIGTPKQSEEKSIDDSEGIEDTGISNDTVDPTPVLKQDEEENADNDINKDSDKEINKDLDGEIDEISSAVQPTEVHDDTEETLPPHISNGDSTLEESVESQTIETKEETLGNAGQNQD